MTQKEVAQFEGQIVDRDFLLDSANSSQLQLNESFIPDHQVIAIISTPESSIGKSIILHETLGWFYIHQTSTSFINEYKSVNFFGFWVSRTIAKMFDLKRHLPLIHMYTAYMPLGSPHNGPTDWVGIHHLEKYYQKDGMAYFVTKSGQTFRLKFKGDLTKKIHDACFMSQYHTKIHEILNGTFGKFKLFKKDLGLIQEYSDCKCETHLKLPTKRREAFIYLTNLIAGIARNWTKQECAMNCETTEKEKMSSFNKKKNWQ